MRTFLRANGALLLAVSLVACGGGSTNPTPTTVELSNSVESSDSTEITDSPVDTTMSQSTDSDVETSAVVITVTVGVDSGPDRVENVGLGQDVELHIKNPDVDDEFHLHGYDLGGEDTPAGEEKVFAFTAAEVGDFEVESHATDEVLVVIRVSQATTMGE